MFEIKPYSRKELSNMYFPNSQSPESAYLNLNRLLEASPEGVAVKKSILRRRLLTKNQVAAIVEVLGEPF